MTSSIQRKRSALWAAGVAIVTLWWMIAFVSSTSTPTSNSTISHSPHVARRIEEVSTLDRAQILQALRGDTEQIALLTEVWAHDLQVLTGEATSPLAERLRHHLAILPSSPSTDQITVEDDAGKTVTVVPAEASYLPQTYVAATIMLSLTDPAQIVAMPAGLRSQTHLLDREKIEQITLDTDRYCGEEISLIRPDVAFVAHYSLPSSRVALERQGVQLFDLNAIETPGQVIEAVERVGQVIGQPERGSVLADFMRLAMTRMDAELAYRRAQRQHQRPLRLLYLSWYEQMKVPTCRTLGGQLLKRLGVEQVLAERQKESPASWSLATDLEEVVRSAPEIIVVTACDEAIANKVRLSPALSTTPAVLHDSVYMVDDATQLSPSQFLALAYYDLFTAIVSAEEAG